MKQRNQHTQILNHLRATKGLTVREAMIDYSIQSFTKRISELRSMGHRIDGIKGKHPVTGQRYTRYVLIEGEKA
jgi:predicted DNA-binding transcriptional regulator YafY